jgi:Pyruvate/2-oxoacid:ferredoxin oxidoreductase delta subunit
MTALLEKGYAVTCVGNGSVTPADGSTLLVLGRFDNGNVPQGKDATGEVLIRFRDIDGLDAEEITALVEKERDESQSAKHGEWKPWFPVIDYDRCTNCMQCLTFCLFDVYGVDKQQQITVQNQDNCKTDCPACSRVCPEVAILFPKYGKGPINGDVVRAEDIQREAMKVDISTLLGGDLYGSLRSRQQDARKRFSTERDESKALLERKRCLGKLKKDLDIPDEVLMTLPSAEDIEERAARAKAKLAKRQAMSQTVKDTRPAPSETEWGI